LLPGCPGRARLRQASAGGGDVTRNRAANRPNFFGVLLGAMVPVFCLYFLRLYFLRGAGCKMSSPIGGCLASPTGKIVARGARRTACSSRLRLPRG